MMEKTIELNFSQTENGMKARIGNGRLKDKEFSLVYPAKIWQSYPQATKDFLFENLAHLLTINLPLIAELEKVEYNTPVPAFEDLFRTVVVKSLPHAVEDYDIKTEDIIKKFLGINYQFNGKLNGHKNFNGFEAKVADKAIVMLSCGKDSLLSLGVCGEAELEPVPVYVNDTVSPSENRIKLRFGKMLAEESGLNFFVVRNELERLNDFETWKKGESCVGYTHMLTGFCLIALPFAHRFGAGHVVLGNQQSMNASFVNKDGFLTYPSYDQTIEWMKRQDRMVKAATCGRTGVMSVIEPLSNIAITRILGKRYPALAKYQVSCDSLDASDEKRWCHECSKCGRLSLFMAACGLDPRSAGFRGTLMQKRHKELYVLFNGRGADCYEKSRDARDQQLLAFLLAYRNGIRGYLIDLFRKRFLEEAETREDGLRKKFFSLHESATMPKHIKKKVFSIYKEELDDVL